MVVDAQGRAYVGNFGFDLDSEIPDTFIGCVFSNEFLDALPVRQLVRTPDGWRERMVALAPGGSGALIAIAGDRPTDAAVPETAASFRQEWRTTASEVPSASPCRKSRPIKNIPSTETITVNPAHTTARPEVLMACTTDSRGVRPSCRASRYRVTMKRA